MPGEFKYGAVLNWKEFQFEDGDSSDKLLIVLGAKPDKNVIAALTTSQHHGRNTEKGCFISDGYFFIAKDTHDFHKNTWVELYRPVELSAAEVVKASMAKDLWVEWNLPENISNEIRNCLKQSTDITDHQKSLLQ